MFYAFLFLFPLITAFTCNPQTQDSFSILQKYSQQFQVEKSINNQFILSHNITFNSSREKYFFIYWPLMQACLQKIGQDFQPILDSATPSGIGAAGYGLVAGMKIAFKVGLWKTGILGLIKTSTATLFSFSALPVAIGVGAMAYFYNKNEQDKIKVKCSAVIETFQTIVRKEQLESLIQIKATEYRQLMQSESSLTLIDRKQNNIKKMLKIHQDKVKYFNSKIQLQQKYFNSLRKIMDN